ncbi:MAG: pentapeptide repeat-containing protein [Nitriliruptorales bacterium]|nr:pentapeptide repeat-containing protein [Nitriliruptorales bacterium]
MAVLTTTRAAQTSVRARTSAAATLSGRNLAGLDLSNARLDGATLANSDLSHTNLEGANLNNTDLRRADLSHARLVDIRTNANTTFEGADTTNTTW